MSPRRSSGGIIDNSISTELGGVREEITVVFTDVRDFTTIAESADPDVLMHQTSRYFSVLTEAFLAEGGTVDKFIGDAVMVFWNAPNPQPDHVERACRAALAGRAACEKLNSQFETEGLKPFFTRFGIHVGEAVVGNLGSTERMNYTALGNTVNLAARLEGLNKQFGTSYPCERRRLFAGSALFPVQSFGVGHGQGHDKGNPRFRARRGIDMKSASALRAVVLGLLVLRFVLVGPTVRADEDTIKIGILHSLSGTMAISESVLKDTVLMLIADQNRKGGLLGRKLEPIVVDPASDWDVFAEKARELLTKEKVAVVFGCWTSASRKSVLPIFEQLNGLLFYPVQYEGEESSRNIFYTGATPNQQAIPAVRYLMSKEGGEVRRWVLLGTDYVYPRTTNRILSAYLDRRGGIARRHYDDLYAVRLFRMARDRRADQGLRFGGKKDRGDINHQRRCKHVLLQGTRSPTGRRQAQFQSWLSRSASANCSVWTSSPSGTWRPGITSNRSSHQKTKRSSKCGRTSTSNETKSRMTRWKPPSLASGCGRKPLSKRAPPTSDAVRQAMYGQRIKAPSGFEVVMNTNHHLSKPVMIGKINSSGTFDVIWQSINPVRADAWSRYIPDSAKRTADWTFPWVCGGCIEPTFKEW